MSASSSPSSVYGATIVKPPVVASGPRSAEHTRNSKTGVSAASRSLPNTTDGTDRWNGLMPSYAITATMVGAGGETGETAAMTGSGKGMARF
ncbi:hypothetical protein FEQ05_06523 [Burkholderia pseudomultivorans]|uniref:Uncharacterized protein n=1 Tax=Burkholderia pseudomultivorans TaxID=1207504 RepID=A0ABU2E988_9BURK|nr:hypothetical protein [Burkholderia pseudomultivorans]MDR8822777.1 hypothetical protein [Burkholderia pseudomultivorans]MDR8851885.1 hypothetical protein [Burkholderia pseudomultivorans]